MITPNQTFKDLFLLEFKLDIPDHEIDKICNLGVWNFPENWYRLIYNYNYSFTPPEYFTIVEKIEKTIEMLKEKGV